MNGRNVQVRIGSGLWCSCLHTTSAVTLDAVTRIGFILRGACFVLNLSCICDMCDITMRGLTSEVSVNYYICIWNPWRDICQPTCMNACMHHCLSACLYEDTDWLFVCLPIWMYVCLRGSLCVWMPACMITCMLPCMPACIYVWIFASPACMPVCKTACVYDCLPIYTNKIDLYMFVYVCLPACLSVYLPACLSPCIYVCLLICLPA